MKKISTLTSKLYFLILSVLLLFPVVALAADGCSLQSFIEDGRTNNWVGPVYNLIRDACSTVAEGSWDIFAPSLQAVVAVGTGIYIAMYTLRNVGSFSQQDVSAYFSDDKTGLFILMAKATFIIALLGNPDFVYQYLIATIIQAGAEVGGAEGWEFGSATDLRSLFNNVIATIDDFNGKAYTIVAIGKALFCLITLPESFLDKLGLLKLVPFGAITYAFGQVLLIYIAFYMMDILFRLGVACMLLPMAIACGISKLTITYTSKLWKLFVNIAFNFVVLGMVLDFTVLMIEASMKTLDGGGADIDAGPSLQEFLKQSSLSSSDVDAVNDLLSLGSFVFLVLSCMIAMKLCMNAEQLAEKISGESGGIKKGSGIGQKLGAKAVSGATKVATAPLNQAGNVAVAAGQQAGAEIMQSKPVRNVRNKWRKFRQWGKRLIGLND